MAVLQGSAVWAGALTCVSCTYTCSHGVTPGVAVFTAVRQSDLPSEHGTLAFTDGIRTLALPNCKIAYLTDVATPNGRVWQLHIFDRRWKWAFGVINGTYNVRDDRGEVIPELRRSAAQLAALCLMAMGEQSAVVTGMPFDQFPGVDWEAANPAEALQALASQYGCRVVYRPDTDTVLVIRQGVGDQLPDGLPVTMDNPVLDPPERPDSLLLVGGVTLYEVLLVAEAVGEDADGEIKPIDDLSYKPADDKGGWKYSIPPNHQKLTQLKPNPAYEELTQDELDAKVRGLAEKTVYKWYRVKLEAPDGSGKPLKVPEFGEVKDRRQLTITPERVTEAVGMDGSLAAKPAEIRGVFWRAKQSTVGPKDPFGNSVNSEKLETPFQIDETRHLVMFDQPVFRKLEKGIGPADLVLRCAVQVRDEKTHALGRFELTREFLGQSLGTGPAVVRRPEIVFKIVGRYTLKNPNTSDAGEWELTGQTDNADDTGPLADYLIRLAAAQYEFRAAQDREYPGILPILPDGAIQQVTWSVEVNKPPTTRASTNTEHAFWLPSFEENRRERFSRERLKPLEPGQQPTMPQPPAPDLKGFY